MAEKLPYFDDIVNLDNNIHGFSPFLYATTASNKENNRLIMELLIKKGANVMRAADDGMTALHWAVMQNDVRSLDFFIKHLDKEA